MENNNEIKETTKLTDEQLDDVVKTLEDNLSEDDKLIRDIIENEINPDKELESEIVNMSVDPNTGNLITEPAPQIVSSRTSSENEEDPFTDDETISEDQFSDNHIDAINDIKESDVNSDTLEKFNISDEDAKQLYTVIMEIRNNRHYEVYKNLPESIRGYADQLIQIGKLNGQTISKETAARYLINEFIDEIKENRELIDIQKSIEKELQMPSITDMYSEHIKDIMEQKLPEAAANIEAEYPDKAATLRAISTMFTESYTFNLMKDTLINNKTARNRIRESSIEYNKYCNAFNARSNNTVVKINDIFMMGQTLNRVLEESIALDDIKKFVVLFCKTCEGLDINNIAHCSYMYYTIKNIITLDFASEAMTDFSKSLINNIVETIEFINQTQASVEASMPEKLLKKKIKKCSRK